MTFPKRQFFRQQRLMENMFNLDGKPSRVNQFVTTLLENSWLKTKYPNEVVCTIYRRDPHDDYLFLTCAFGVLQMEPMYGPRALDDQHSKLVAPDISVLGEERFASRERIKWTSTPITNIDSPLSSTSAPAPETWRIHLSGRNQLKLDDWHNIETSFRNEILPILRLILNETPDEDRLFPSLWHAEREARDTLREASRTVSTAGNIEVVEQEIRQILQRIAQRHLPGNTNHIGIYLNDGEEFGLPSDQDDAFLPTSIRAKVNFSERPSFDNAFAWVARTMRTAFIHRNPSACWKHLLENCRSKSERSDSKFMNAIQEHPFGGLSIVPLPDLTQSTPALSNKNETEGTMGMLAVVSMCPRDPGGTTKGSDVYPAHHFLWLRLARVVSAYLTSFLPLRGYACWPREALWRGKARCKIYDHSRAADNDTVHKVEILRQFVEDLMPRSSEVEVKPESSDRAGFSGATVFQLRIVDRNNIREIPRIIKIGPKEKIVKEWRNYYKFVHNKSVGGAARIDTACLKRIPVRDGVEEWGAIIYNMVGAGEIIQPWSEWAASVTHDEIESGLRKLHQQLRCWHDPNKRPPGETLTTVILEKPFLQPGWKKLDTVTTATHQKVQALLLNLKTVAQRSRGSLPAEIDTFVIHGDLHAGNVFSITPNSSDSSPEVAVIDWGDVTEGSHPLVDLGKLIVDLVYRVRWNARSQKHAKEWHWMYYDIPKRLNSWGFVSGKTKLNHEAWKLALIHHMIKVLVYSWQSESKVVHKTEALKQIELDVDLLIKEALGSPRMNSRQGESH